MKNSVYVVEVGMTPFVKPGANEPYTLMGVHAARSALEDAGLDYTSVHMHTVIVPVVRQFSTALA